MLSISVDDRLELHGLYDWLRQDRALSRDAEIILASSGRNPGEQSTLDVIQLISGTAIQLTGLGVAIAGYRLARRRDMTVTLGRGGQEITTDATAAAASDTAIESLPPDDDSPADPPAPHHRPGS